MINRGLSPEKMPLVLCFKWSIAELGASLYAEDGTRRRPESLQCCSIRKRTARRRRRSVDGGEVPGSRSAAPGFGESNRVDGRGWGGSKRRVEVDFQAISTSSLRWLQRAAPCGETGGDQRGSTRQRTTKIMGVMVGGDGDLTKIRHLSSPSFLMAMKGDVEDDSFAWVSLLMVGVLCSCRRGLL